MNIKDKFPAVLINHTLASPVLQIKGAPEYLRLAAEGPLRIWTTVLDDQTARMSVVDSMQQALALHQQTAVIEERARMRMIRLVQDTGKISEQNKTMLAEKEKTGEVVDGLQKEKDDAQKAVLDRDEQIAKLKAELETKEKDNHELALHLRQAEEENTRLGLRMSKMHMAEDHQSMINFSYSCAFADEVRTAHRVLSAEQLEPFKTNLKEWLVDFPPAPGCELPFADLREIGFDFAFLPEGVEVVDPPSDEETAEGDLLRASMRRVGRPKATRGMRACLARHYRIPQTSFYFNHRVFWNSLFVLGLSGSFVTWSVVPSL